MAIEVFNRYENKYLLDGDTFEKLQSGLCQSMGLDTHNRGQETYPVASLYYDTPDNTLIRTSLQKPRYKEKLRLRAYGVPGPDEKVYVEIKKKVAGLVNKRRSALRLEDAYDFLASGAPPRPRPYQNRQVLREIAYLLQTYDLYPAVYLAYDRLAWFGTAEPDLRVSFDRNIRTRRYDLALEAGDYGAPLLERGQCLMEIKAAKSIPLWLCRLLSEDQIYPASFSKYGAEYRKTLETAKTPHPVYSFIPRRAVWPRAAAANA